MTITSGGARLLRDAAFPQIKQAAIGLTGMAYWEDKEDALAEVVSRLLDDRRLPPSLFATRLAHEAGRGPETDALVSTVTVGETSFFRYPEQFSALEEVALPERLAANAGHRSLSLWSAGCSVGAEIYSVSILLRQVFALPLAGWRLHLLGTDISPAALRNAQAGIYSEWVVRDMPARMRQDCFTPVADGQLRLRDSYRDSVVFTRHNLVADPPPPSLHGGFDLVLCRNVLMYFDTASRARAVACLHRGMAPGGWLLVGHAETGIELPGFEPVRVKDWLLFRKTPLRGHVNRPPATAALPPSPVADESRFRAGGAHDVSALLDCGDYVQAVTACRAWTDQQPLVAEAHYHLGLALEALSDSQAIQAFRRAVYLAPDFALAHFHLLRLLRRQGDDSLARRHGVALRGILAGLDANRPLWLGGGMTASELARLADRMDEAG